MFFKYSNCFSWSDVCGGRIRTFALINVCGCAIYEKLCNENCMGNSSYHSLSFHAPLGRRKFCVCSRCLSVSLCLQMSTFNGSPFNWRDANLLRTPQSWISWARKWGSCSLTSFIIHIVMFYCVLFYTPTPASSYFVFFYLAVLLL